MNHRNWPGEDSDSIVDEEEENFQCLQTLQKLTRSIMPNRLVIWERISKVRSDHDRASIFDERLVSISTLEKK